MMLKEIKHKGMKLTGTAAYESRAAEEHIEPAFQTGES